MKKSLMLALLAVTLVGCSTTNNTPAPTKMVQVQTTPSQEVFVPNWYDSPPESTADALYVTGSGESTNFEFSRDKARLSAARMLCHQLNGEMNSMTKQFQQEVGKRFTENTRTSSKKVCTDTNLTGYTQAKVTTIRNEGRFQSFVLLKYPLGKNNFLLEEQMGLKAERESAMAERQGQIDLERERQDKRKFEAQQSRRVQEMIAPDTVTTEPKVDARPEAKSEAAPSTANQLPHETVSDPKIKQQVEAALKRGDALIIKETVQ